MLPKFFYMEILNALNWRYAAKRMSGKKVEDEKIAQIVEAIRLSPSSLGLHPYHLLLISDQKTKEKIRAVAHNQPQITEASHLIIFAGWDNYTLERIDSYIKNSEEIRHLPEGFSEPFRKRLKNSLLTQEETINFSHIARQAYIGLGLGLAAAAELQIDSTPIEGFENKDLDELLNLSSLHLKSLVILALGYRDEENDYNLKWKKVRPQTEDFVIEMKLD